jgi:hypothetical protein
MAQDAFMAPNAFDAQGEALRRKFALAEQLQKPLDASGGMVGNVYVGNPFQTFANIYRGSKGQEREAEALQGMQDLQTTRATERSALLADALKQMQGAPAFEAAGPAPQGQEQGGGYTVPAMKPDLMGGYSQLAGSTDPMLQQVGLHGITKIPEIQAAKEAEYMKAKMQADKDLQIARERAADRKEMAQLTASMRPERQAQIIQTDQGPMQLVNGKAMPIIGTNGVPVKGAASGKPPSTEYAKNATALLNMNDALDNYKDKLSTFKAQDALNPAKRAEMGTAYQNTLLQAKEMYQLGVLNGPDERILKSIIESPLDFKSAIIPTESLKKQADDLKGIIKRNASNLSRVHQQPELDFSPRAPSNAGGGQFDEGKEARYQAWLKKQGGQ